MKQLSKIRIAALVLLIGGLTTGCAASSTPEAAGQSPSTSTAAQSPAPSSSAASATPPQSDPTKTAAATSTVAPPTAAATPAKAAAPAPAKAAKPAPVAPAPVAPAGGTATSVYPTHTNVISTTFWVGEIFNASLADGSQVCSTYSSQWAFQHTGVNLGTTPASASGCPGSIYGGCDGVSSGTGTNFTCSTEARDASNGYFPKNQPQPKENPFYLDLPYDDVNDTVAFQQRCSVIPWAASDNAATGVDHCKDPNYSYMKNRWVKLSGPNGNVCYGQIQDAGPSSGTAYHDAGYVFGSQNLRPANADFSTDATQGAGMDVSPALNGCLGFAELNGSGDHVSWSFVDRANVPAGPWLKVQTTSGVS
ncbi:hypothetical protein AB4Y86_14385 [Arthrobacter sp. 2YAF22_2]|uniref:hypothetical protein n=1 Tax=Arthrobacter sp. 2YAF22_2 TaxID=3233029 RepID=UPI003F90714D